MSGPPPAAPTAEYDYDDTWLPTDWKPITFRQMVWDKLKSAPLVGVGVLATGVSLVMASYQMKLGNSSRFNYWLRWRVAAQAATIGAAVYYGGVAFTKQQQDEYMARTLIILGERRPPTKIQSNDEILAAAAAAASSSPAPSSSSSSSSSSPTTTSTSTSTDMNDGAYPLPPEERLKVSDFARRLKAAEEAQRVEDAAIERGEGGGARRRLERRVERERERERGRREE